MIRLALLAASAATLIGATQPHPAATAATAPGAPGMVPDRSSAMATSAAAPAVRLPGFAAALADQPLIHGPAAWPQHARESAWAAVAAAKAGSRQPARWQLATALLGDGRGADAMGVLDVMVADDPDLSLVPAWQRAHGVAAAIARHGDTALSDLADPRLADDAESCLWRLRVLAEDGQAQAALRQIACAMPALALRPYAARRPFVMAAGDAAVAIGRYRPALNWLRALPDGDAAANLLRGRALSALGEAQEARLRLDRAQLSGGPEIRAAARLAIVQSGLQTNTLAPAVAAKQLDALLFGWRGDAIEREGLRVAMQLADRMHDPERFLAAGAALFRHGATGSTSIDDAGTGALLMQLQAQLAAVLSPTSKLSLDRAAGLFWDYRDIAPGGAAGDQLAEALIARLQATGLYARAADLLQHRMAGAPMDIERGPLATRIASLRILAGDPVAAVRVLRESDVLAYPAEIAADRARVEAVALELSGNHAEALAVLQDVAGSTALSSEILWRHRDWAALAALNAAALPAARRLNQVEQTIVLRQAIALAMLGRDQALGGLRSRYAAAFAGLPTAPIFAMLTDSPATVDPAALGRAMAALPAESPAGAAGELMDQGAAALAQPG